MEPQGGTGQLLTRPAVSHPTVRAKGVVMPVPGLDRDLCLGRRVDDFAIQQFVALQPL